MTRKMGMDATLTVQLRPGAAQVYSLDIIGWDFQYDGGSNVVPVRGAMIDISWALGESAPSIAYR